MNINKPMFDRENTSITGVLALIGLAAVAFWLVVALNWAFGLLINL